MSELYLCSAILFIICVLILVYAIGKANHRNYKESVRASRGDFPFAEIPPRPGGPPRDIPKCKPRTGIIEDMRHLGMLRQKPKYITVEAVFGKKWIGEGALIADNQDLMDELERRLQND